jgi:formylmethanofuran dehydrogenase subunit C
MLKIEVRHDSDIPLEMPGILPERVANLTPLAASKHPVLLGNRRLELGEVATVSKDGSDAQLWFVGNTGRLKNLGAGMNRGMIWVYGDAGMHAGAGMNGGLLHILGSAGDWCGAEMRGGQIEVRGSAGNQLGAAYRGSRHGMRGGAIVVHGNAGDEAGLLMRRGVIAVGGKVGRFAGATMIAGTLVALGGAGSQCGAGMKRGTIVLSGDVPELPETFRYSCEFESAWLGLLKKQLRELGFELPKSVPQCYRGDELTGSKGEIMIFSDPIQR